MAVHSPSLVADDLVDLVRDAVGPDVERGGHALRYGDGRIVAVDVTIIELLVEIRDLLRDEVYEPSIDELRDGAGS